MSNKIVGPTGLPVSSEPTSGEKSKATSPRMEDRIQAALDAWLKGDKDVAFANALNAIAYLSSGLAGMARLVRQLETNVKELNDRVNLMPPPTTPPNAEL